MAKPIEIKNERITNSSYQSQFYFLKITYISQTLVYSIYMYYISCTVLKYPYPISIYIVLCRYQNKRIIWRTWKIYKTAFIYISKYKSLTLMLNYVSCIVTKRKALKLMIICMNVVLSLRIHVHVIFYMFTCTCVLSECVYFQNKT